MSETKSGKEGGAKSATVGGGLKDRSAKVAKKEKKTYCYEASMVDINIFWLFVTSSLCISHSFLGHLQQGQGPAGAQEVLAVRGVSQGSKLWGVLLPAAHRRGKRRGRKRGEHHAHLVFQ